RGAVTSVASSADGTIMFSRGADDIIRRWDAQSGKELGQFTEPKGTLSAVFSTDGNSVAFANADGPTGLYSTVHGKLLHQVIGHRNGAASMAFSPDGKTFASRGSVDNTMRIYDVVKGVERKAILLPNLNP